MKLRYLFAAALCATVALAQDATSPPDQGQSVGGTTGSFSGNVTIGGTTWGQDAGFQIVTAVGVDAGSVLTGHIQSGTGTFTGALGGTTATLSGAAVIGTGAYAPVVDAGVVIVPTSGKVCLDGPGCAVNVQWGGGGGGGVVQFGASSGNTVSNSGQTVTGTSKLRDVISNDTTGGACVGETGSVGFKDRVAVCNGSNVTMFTVSDTDGTTTVGAGIANQAVIAGSTTTNPVTVTATGSDSNIDVNVVPKGTGSLEVKSREVSVFGGTSKGPQIECEGECVMSSGTCTVDFTTDGCEDFGGTPRCQCFDMTNTTETTCSATSRSTTGFQANGTGSATYGYRCWGAAP